MSEPLVVQSHRGPYEVHFNEQALEQLNADPPRSAHFVIDRRIADLYGRQMDRVLAAPSVLLIEATENNKSLECFPSYVEHLIGRSIRRGHALVAIGGGIIQDITCFLAATLLRGVDWHFYPTTLLAQADSCIGSKSSINCAGAKNILGTFTPPQSVTITTSVLRTLDERDVRSGIGEMLKVHAIEGPESFQQIADDYDRILTDDSVMASYIRASLEIKRRIIEIDEFDRGVRNVMNYGHTFGHAIESATDFAVPHGIAVTIGMDMANFVAAGLGRTSPALFEQRHPLLKVNFHDFEQTDIPFEPLLGALAKDKKNTDAQLSLVLPNHEGVIERALQTNNAEFQELCRQYLDHERSR